MERIGRYEVRGHVARGGMGAVYRAYDPRAQREVAIKVLLGGARASDTVRKRFLREAQALSRLRHPHVVAVHEVGEHARGAFMVMDLIEGVSLQERLDREGPLPIAAALTLAIALADALEHVHGHGLLHRDLKPANVLIDAAGRPQLVDFGLTRELGDSAQSRLSKSGMFLGSPGYWPPEQARGELERLGPATDVYGLGGILFAALTGAPPQPPAESLIEAIEGASLPPQPPSARRSEISRALDAVCLRALDPDPAARFAAPAELGAALADVQRMQVG